MTYDKKNGNLYAKSWLMHHGIKGQQWGVQHGPPYPLDSSVSTGKRLKGDDTGMSRFATHLSKDNFWNMSDDDFQSYDDNWKEQMVSINSDGSWRGFMPEKPEYRETRRRSEYLNNPDEAMSMHLGKVNPTQGQEAGTTNNCTAASAAGALARMGYDFSAGRLQSGDAGAINYWFDGNKSNKFNSYDDADNYLTNADNGSFGTINFRNVNGGGHVFNWDKSSKGEYRLYENQAANGKKYSGSTAEEAVNSYLNDHPWFSKNLTVQIDDLTNASPNWDHMAEDGALRVLDDPNYQSYIYTKHNNSIYKYL